MIVGWVTSPPRRIPIRASKCFSPKSPQLSPDAWAIRNVAIVFVGYLNDPRVDVREREISLHCAAVPLSDVYDAHHRWFPDVDPAQVFGRLQSRAETEIGTLRLGSGNERRMQIQFHHDAPGFEELRQLHTTPRIPGFYGAMTRTQDIASEPFRSWLLHHSRPIPPGYLEDSARTLAPDARSRDDITTGPLGQAIQRWHASKEPLRRENRGKIFDHLVRWLGDSNPLPAPLYRAHTLSALNAALSVNRVKVDENGSTRVDSYRNWITLAYAEEVDRWNNAGRPSNQPYVPAIGNMGIEDGDYLYTFTFETGAALPLPKVVTGKIPEPGNYVRFRVPGFSIGFNPFYANVRLQKVEAVRDGQGRAQVDAKGKIRVTPKGEPIFDTAHDSLSGLIGVFIDVGFGFPKPGLNIKEVQILSANGTLTKNSFDGASFQIGTIKGPGATGPLEAGAQAGGSVAFSVSRDSGGVKFDLTTLVDIPPSLTNLQADKPGDFLKPLLSPGQVRAKYQDLLKPSWNLFSGGLALGYFVAGGRSTRITPSIDTPAPPARPAEVAIGLDLDDFFELNKSEIPTNQAYISTYSRLAVVEASLAEYLAVLINPSATRFALGWTSPEGETLHNLKLSVDRAQALAHAYLDAFPAGRVPPIPPGNIIGRGEGPSLEKPGDRGVQLQDPEAALGMTARNPSFRASYEEWVRRNADQVALWPGWRRAQLQVDGVVIIALGAPQKP
ncbi:hypothetical protein ACFQW6_03565 [Nocardioides sp. GCM10028917]|uniref:hypothetical protein n=1 Tax=Nocardioides sp. GCM10028917 TaxID=3273408 RepID=UPI00360EBEA9